MNVNLFITSKIKHCTIGIWLQKMGTTLRYAFYNPFVKLFNLDIAYTLLVFLSIPILNAFKSHFFWNLDCKTCTVLCMGSLSDDHHDPFFCNTNYSCRISKISFDIVHDEFRFLQFMKTFNHIKDSLP